MKNNVISIFNATRPLEYVSFFNVKFSTKEGPAYTFFAVDAFSEYAFSTETEPDEKLATVLKNIYLLTELPEFSRQNTHGFTLVLDKYEELADRIEGIISSINGKLLFHPEFHKEISSPVIKSIAQYMRQL